ncbi:MAG: glutamine amidotransferase [Thermomicrobiales bacterium]|nr:glutamine amidotransferase [Thermomicrobiales bacterium]
MAQLVIAWLYNDRMSIYGDRGNVIAMQRRAEWRGIDVEVANVSVGESLPERVDVYFFGGGQDEEQIAVARDLQGEKAARIRADIEAGAAALTVCGGYQLFGHEYRPFDAAPLPGISVLDVVSVASKQRFIGNVVIDSEWGELVGFENHSGLTSLGPGAEPIGRVRVGRGNNGRDGFEGARYKNAIGCYLHGSLLPKNPRLTDWLIAAGLEHATGEPAVLAPLHDEIEAAAHATAVQRAIKTR